MAQQTKRMKEKRRNTSDAHAFEKMAIQSHGEEFNEANFDKALQSARSTHR